MTGTLPVHDMIRQERGHLGKKISSLCIVVRSMFARPGGWASKNSGVLTNVKSSGQAFYFMHTKLLKCTDDVSLSH